MCDKKAAGFLVISLKEVHMETNGHKRIVLARWRCHPVVSLVWYRWAGRFFFSYKSRKPSSFRIDFFHRLARERVSTLSSVLRLYMEMRPFCISCYCDIFGVFGTSEPTITHNTLAPMNSFHYRKLAALLGKMTSSARIWCASLLELLLLPWIYRCCT